MNRLIVTDLEGIIIDIDVPRCFPEFKRLMGENFYRIGLIGSGTPGNGIEPGDLAIRFEVGEWTESQFLTMLKNMCIHGTDTETVRKVWNSMMLSVPPEKYEVLRSVRSKADKFVLLSNTNEVHWRFIDENNHLSPFFDDIVLSCREHCLKPSGEIFRRLLSKPCCAGEFDEIWFADDVEANRTAAEKFGWRTFPTIEALNDALCNQ